MLPASEGDSSEGRTAVDNATVRTLFLVGPDKKIKLSLTYPMSTGRNFDEILRVIDSLQLTARHKVATPANWSPGNDVIIGQDVTVLVHDAPASHAEPPFGLAEYSYDCRLGLPDNPYGIAYPWGIFGRDGKAKGRNEE